MRLFALTSVRVHGILKVGTLVATRGRHQKKEYEQMRKYLIVLLLLMATLGYAVRAKNATQTPCRPFPKVSCQPETHPEPCPPLVCPDVDRNP